MANQPGIGDYSALLSATAGARDNVPIKAEDIANAHRSALEMTKTLGEVKSYLSGRVVTKKILENLSRTPKANLDKIGVDTEELQANYNAALQSAGREAQSLVQGARKAITDTFGKEPVVRTPRGEISNPAFDPEADTGFADVEVGSVSKTLSGVGKSAADNLAETSFGETVKSSIGNAVGKAGKVVKVGNEASAEGGGVSAEVGEGASILDGIPGVDILGLAVGLGATLYGAFHHVKEPKPADGVHIAPVMGVE